MLRYFSSGTGGRLLYEPQSGKLKQPYLQSSLLLPGLIGLARRFPTEMDCVLRKYVKFATKGVGHLLDLLFDDHQDTGVDSRGKRFSLVGSLNPGPGHPYGPTFCTPGPIPPPSHRLSPPPMPPPSTYCTPPPIPPPFQRCAPLSSSPPSHCCTPPYCS